MAWFPALLVSATLAWYGAQMKEIPVSWESIGPGGGGGHFYASVSPHDPNLLFIACDMSGFYRSGDGGKHWRMLPGDQIRNIESTVTFHPRDQKVCFVGGRHGLYKSSDGGESWTHATGRGEPNNRDFCVSTVVDLNAPERIASAFNVYMSKPGSYVVGSPDGGKTWAASKAWPAGGERLLRLVIDPRGKASALYAATEGCLYRSRDHGGSWETVTRPPEGHSFLDFQGGFDGGKSMLLLSVSPALRDGSYAGGLLRSRDDGKSWAWANNGLYTVAKPGRRWRSELSSFPNLAMSPGHPDRAYASSTCPRGDYAKLEFPTVYATRDGGDSWEAVLRGDPAMPNPNVEDAWLNKDLQWWFGGVGVPECRSGDPDDVTFTDAMRSFRSRDGGKTWKALYSERVGKTNWRGNGLEVTTCYKYYFDPKDRNRTYIAYTDIGLFRSEDRGNTWMHAAKLPPQGWINTCYEMALDPDRKGVVYAAFSRTHDMPHWKIFVRGGRGARGSGAVGFSDDHAATWKRLGEGTLGDRCVTSIVLDPRSPAERRTLWASAIGVGVFRSTDGGATWTDTTAGLDAGPNRNFWVVRLHPDGTLYAATTIAYEDGKPVPGALYRSKDSGGSWERVAGPRGMDFIFNVECDPRDSRVAYVSCFDVVPEGATGLGAHSPWPDWEGGGLYKTTDGGGRWEKILDKAQCWSVELDAGRPDGLYACTFVDGVFRSEDGGKTWAHLANPPHLLASRLTVDPEDPKVVYVSTFGGGMWKGTIRR